MHVSVLIAAFNAAGCIARALASVQAQSVRELEVLVIDDASTDETAAIVASHAERDPRIRLLRAPVNRGPGVARNLGLEAARGEWIAILDADDRFHPERIGRLLALAGRHGADMVADNLHLCPDGRPSEAVMLPPEWVPEDKHLTADEFVLGNISGSRRTRLGYGYLKPLIRRGFLERTGVRYDPARFAEDYLFFLACLLRGAYWIVTPIAMYDYAVAAGSGTACHDAADLEYLMVRERALLETAGRLGDVPLCKVMRRHLRSVGLALAWFRFAEALKRRDPAAAVAELSRDPPTTIHILREGLRAVPRLLARV
jgi:succinoglycan biosynthesis protein ExoO